MAAQLTIGAWLSMTKEDITPEDKRWFGIELTREQWLNILPNVLNKLGSNTLISTYDIRKKIHVDIYTDQKGIDDIYDIIDNKLCKRGGSK